MVKKAKQKENAKRKKAAAKSPVVRAAVVNKPSKKSGNFDKVYKSPKKSGWQKFVDYLRKRPVLMFLIVFLVLGAGFVAFNQYQIYQEKKDFEQAEIILDELANSIADSLGKPVDVNKEKFCSYRSVKFEDPGPPACSINYKLIYVFDSEKPQSIDLIALKLDELVANKESLSLDSKLAVDIDYNPKLSADSYTRSEIIIDDVGLSCNLRLSESFLSNGVIVSFGCLAQDSKAQYFPVKD